MSDIIERAEAALKNAHGLPWSTDPCAQEPDDCDSDAWVDVDGSLGGWVAHCQDLKTAFFMACAPGLIREFVAALKAARGENVRLHYELAQALTHRDLARNQRDDARARSTGMSP